MKTPKIKIVNDQSNRTGHGQHEKHQRCDLCNVPIFRNPCSDARSETVLKGKGSVLCNKCAITLEKIPTEQALQALENSSKTYLRD